MSISHLEFLIFNIHKTMMTDTYKNFLVGYNIELDVPNFVENKYLTIQLTGYLMILIWYILSPYRATTSKVPEVLYIYSCLLTILKNKTLEEIKRQSGFRNPYFTFTSLLNVTDSIHQSVEDGKGHRHPLYSPQKGFWYCQ